MNLSHWGDYNSKQGGQILSEIGSMVRNHAMPPQRYLLLHPEARLTGSETEQLYQWTRSERKRLKTSNALVVEQAASIHPIVDQE